MRSEVRLTPVGPLDGRLLAALVEIQNRQIPEVPTTPDELRYWIEAKRLPPAIHYEVVAEDRPSGHVVGWGELGTQSHTFDPRVQHIAVLVHPEWEHRGIGRGLAEHLRAVARQRRVGTLVAVAPVQNPRSMDFLQRQGFTERRRSWQSVLDLSTASIEAVPDRSRELEAEGIHLTTLAAEGPTNAAVLQRIYEAHEAASADIPRLGTFSGSSKEDFRRSTLTTAGFLPEGFFLARHGDRYIGMSNLETLPAEPGVLLQVFTGVRREWRGRGVALELKRRGVEFARHSGFRSIKTYNDSANEPIWSINRRLGYQRRHELVHAELRLGGPGSGDDSRTA